MTATNHVLTGMTIGAVVHQPALALPLAFMSHFICDALPHFGGPDMIHWFDTYLLLDCLLAAILLLVLFFGEPSGWLLIGACGVAAASPDLMWVPRYIRQRQGRKAKSKSNLIVRFHARIQWSETPQGILLEIVWATVVGVVLLKVIR